MTVVIRHSGEEAGAAPAPAAPRSALARANFSLPLPAPPVSSIDKILFADNLATILDAGLSIYDSLDILEEEAKNARMRRILGDLKERVRAGQPLWVGLQAHPEVFPPLVAGLVKVGESGGKLVEVLTRLSAKLRKEYELRGKVVAAAMYPVIVALAMIAVAVLMMIFVVPKLAGVFLESGMALPVQTRALIVASDFVVTRWREIIAVLAALVLASVFAGKARAVRRFRDRVILRLPVAGQVARQSELVWFAVNLRILLSSGFPVVESFELLAQTAVNSTYRDAFLAVGERVKRGMPIAEALRAEGRTFPSLFQRMVRVGETTGKLDETLGKLSSHYESKLDGTLSNVAVLLNPILTLLIGLFVALVALAIIMPVYQLTGAFS
jgi:type IV pilus assembly protein PilC